MASLGTTSFSTASISQTGLAAAVTAAMAWAATGLFIGLLPAVPATVLVAARFVIALGAALLILRRRAVRALRRVWADRTAWGLATLMVLLYTAAVAAYQHAPVADVTLLSGTAPLFVMAWRLVQGRSIPVAERWGAALAIGGTGLIVGPDLLGSGATGSAGASDRIVGNVLALGTGALAAAYAVVFRQAEHRATARGTSAPSTIGVTLLTFVLGAVALSAAVGTAAPDASLAAMGQLTHGWALVLLLGLGVLSTALPTLAYALASQRLSSVLATGLRLLTPVAATALAIPVLGEVPHWLYIPGATLVICGLMLMLQARS
jgi:drug/metabolite transporter (DMT)-like permease